MVADSREARLLRPCPRSLCSESGKHEMLKIVSAAICLELC